MEKRKERNKKRKTVESLCMRREHCQETPFLFKQYDVTIKTCSHIMTVLDYL